MHASCLPCNQNIDFDTLARLPAFNSIFFLRASLDYQELEGGELFIFYGSFPAASAAGSKITIEVWRMFSFLLTFSSQSLVLKIVSSCHSSSLEVVHSHCGRLTLFSHSSLLPGSKCEEVLFSVAAERCTQRHYGIAAFLQRPRSTDTTA